MYEICKGKGKRSEILTSTTVKKVAHVQHMKKIKSKTPTQTQNKHLRNIGGKSKYFDSNDPHTTFQCLECCEQHSDPSNKYLIQCSVYKL